MSAEKRKVSTDALETLGNIIEGGGRDAIHLAVEPVIAGQTLYPGANVGLKNGVAYSNLDKAHPQHVEKHLGIVDPFLKEPVKPGEMFWLVVYPRQITSLRHVWSHPDFPSEEDTEISKRVADKLLGGSEEWIRNYASELGFTYSRLMEAAREYQDTGDYLHLGQREEDLDDKFWGHYENVTGKKIESKGSFFSCAC